MPFRRRGAKSNRSRRAPVVRRRRPVYRRSAIMRSRNYNKIYNFHQTVPYTPTIQAAGGVANQITWTLSLLTQAATFTALYAEYRIRKVVMKWIPTQTQVSTAYTAPLAGLPTTTPGVFGTIISKSFAPTFVALNNFTQCQTWKWQAAASKKPHVRVCYPSIDTYVYAAAGSPVAIQTRQWIETASQAVPHYGMWQWCDPYQSVDTAQSWTCEATIYVQFRNVI